MPNVILDKKQLREIIPFSMTHIGRMEAAGEFPKRIKIGPNRVGWLADEVDEWIERKAAERD